MYWTEREDLECMPAPRQEMQANPSNCTAPAFRPGLFPSLLPPQLEAMNFITHPELSCSSPPSRIQNSSQKLD